MRKYTIGRYFVKIRRAYRDLLIKALFALSVTIIAVVFGSAVPVENSKNGTEQTAQHHADDQESDWEHFRKTVFRDPVAFFTLVLAISTIGLWSVTRRGIITQGRDTRRALVTARDSANADKESADLSRKSFIASQRPNLRIRNIVIKGDSPGWTETKGFPEGIPFSGQFYASNVGETNCNVIEYLCVPYWSVGLPMKRPYEGENGTKVKIPLAPSQSATLQIVSGDISATSFDEAYEEASRAGSIRFYIMGWVEYIDDLDIRRRSAFCREYKSEEGSRHRRFYPVDAPDYEHEE